MGVCRRLGGNYAEQRPAGLLTPDGAVVVVSSDDVFKGAPAIFSQQTTGLDWSDVGIEAVCLAVVTTLVYVRTRPPLPKAG